MSGRVGKHTDAFAQELIWNTEGKTEVSVWFTDGWKAYERQLSDESELWVGKSGTQRIERTNGILRQQTGRWHRRQNKFSKLWEKTEMAVRLAIRESLENVIPGKPQACLGFRAEVGILLTG